MIGDLFDSPWKILIVALVIIVLFGSKKLPSAARSLGQSMRILKKEVQGLHEDEPEPPAAAAAEISHPTPAVGLPNPGVSADRIKRFGHSRDLGHVTYQSAAKDGD
jgi:sec-independent protein translocase protein TatA